MDTACLGDRGTHVIAKYNMIGAWAAIRSCQIWAAAPSSVWGAVPCKARKTNTAARAPRDIATGRKALGCFSMLQAFISSPYGFAVADVLQYYHKALYDKEQLRKRSGACRCYAASVGDVFAEDSLIRFRLVISSQDWP